MIVSISKESEKVSEFPKLMVHDNIIILAVGVYENMNTYMGVVVNNNPNYSIGEYADDWTEKFEGYNGEVTLTNK